MNIMKNYFLVIKTSPFAPESLSDAVTRISSVSAERFNGI